MQVGFLEVIKNTVVEDYKKNLMNQCVWHFLIGKILYEKVVADEELKQKLETFRIIVNQAPRINVQRN
ncbi:42038_t:CDS:2 [Gigaspora margarita]|uniref:42038_t:CDS:1 n=1 Tax=Gigaspora margarita TaxID=4874 RepID=A0ABN7UEW2_GIGMA|nr:42038_t:CDS:2 [Gigaspora margarita]